MLETTILIEREGHKIPVAHSIIGRTQDLTAETDNIIVDCVPMAQQQKHHSQFLDVQFQWSNMQIYQSTKNGHDTV